MNAGLKNAMLVGIVNGMSYLHESQNIAHGNLSSRVCMLDNAWNVKIGSWVPFDCLEECGQFKRCTPKNAISAKKRDRMWFVREPDFVRLLWRAPEQVLDMLGENDAEKLADILLGSFEDEYDEAAGSKPIGKRAKRSSGIGSKQLVPRYVFYRTRPSDVYSFGVIIKEIWSQEIPFCKMMNQVQTEYDLALLIATGALVPSPHPSMNFDVRSHWLLQECTEKQAKVRPSFTAIQKRLLESVSDKRSALDFMMDATNGIQELALKMKQSKVDLDRAQNELSRLLGNMMPKLVSDSLMRKLRVNLSYFQTLTFCRISQEDLAEQCGDFQMVIAGLNDALVVEEQSGVYETLPCHVVHNLLCCISFAKLLIVFCAEQGLAPLRILIHSGSGIGFLSGVSVPIYRVESEAMREMRVLFAEMKATQRGVAFLSQASIGILNRFKIDSVQSGENVTPQVEKFNREIASLAIDPNPIELRGDELGALHQIIF
ncbi:Nitrogen permease regulator 2 [Cichlidogyrus casuarinus]|uniref:guanylate cyclase n=1 Tax=Cichlidogyrus casuarinus TaxID=1844966 RepID=A0ABD2PP39_9PLAT